MTEQRISGDRKMSLLIFAGNTVSVRLPFCAYAKKSMAGKGRGVYNE